MLRHLQTNVGIKVEVEDELGNNWRPSSIREGTLSLVRHSPIYIKDFASEQ